MKEGREGGRPMRSGALIAAFGLVTATCGGPSVGADVSGASGASGEAGASETSCEDRIRTCEGAAFLRSDGKEVGFAEVTYYGFRPAGPSEGENACEAANGPSRLEFDLATSGLNGGHAYTLWVAIFNHAEGCLFGDREKDTLCGDGDIANPLAFPSLMYGAGDVADADGNARFVGEILQREDVDGIVSGPQDTEHPVLFGPGLVNPRSAEIRMIVRDHGPSSDDPRETATFNGGCEDELGNDLDTFDNLLVQNRCEDVLDAFPTGPTDDEGCMIQPDGPPLPE